MSDRKLRELLIASGWSQDISEVQNAAGQLHSWWHDRYRVGRVHNVYTLRNAARKQGLIR